MPVRIGSLPSTCADTMIMVLNSLLRCGCGVNGEEYGRRSGASDRVIKRATDPVELALAGCGLAGERVEVRAIEGSSDGQRAATE